MKNNWRTIRKARLDPDGKSSRLWGLAWVIIGLGIGWALAKGF